MHIQKHEIQYASWVQSEPKAFVWNHSLICSNTVKFLWQKRILFCFVLFVRKKLAPDGNFFWILHLICHMPRNVSPAHGLKFSVQYMHKKKIVVQFDAPETVEKVSTA